MHIKALRVEGGFLDGLNLSFDSDLNVLIGGRGVGKTAVLELIRFCLSSKNLDPELSTESHNHAVGVLDDGVATLVVEHEGDSYTLSRSTSDRRPPEFQGPQPLILSQREIETLARTPVGRMNLLDSFLTGGLNPPEDVFARVKSLSVEIRDLCSDIDELEEQLEDLPTIESELQKMKNLQVSLGAASDERDQRLKKLEKVQSDVNVLTVKDHALSLIQDRLHQWTQSLPKRFEIIGDLKAWTSPQDPILKIRKDLEEDVNTIVKLRGRAEHYEHQVAEQRNNLAKEKAPKEEVLRQLRQALEEEQEGSGRVAREITRLNEKKSRIHSLAKLLKELKEKAQKKHAERMEKLAALNQWRESLFERRQAVASKLSDSLKPRVKIDVKHLADVTRYEEAVIECLRGSNLRYSQIAPLIAKEMSPSELCEMVFSKSSVRLAELLNISEDRAARLMSALSSGDLEEVLLAPIYDVAEFYLLDGTTYKHIDELSIGQRCTVVLSVVLENIDVTLVVDQPEDHLDNEFVAEILIKAISSRAMKAQTIVSTHNANIPVLGEAEQVVYLHSNGHRGFVKSVGTLADSSVVEAILSVMEGGVDAFRKRAVFYRAR